MESCASLHIRRVERPWGFYEEINSGKRWAARVLTVYPGKKLKLQSHHHRSEHWVVVCGTAQVELSGALRLVFENESVFVKVGEKHCLSNPGKINLEIVEIRTGTYLDEDDIELYNDGSE